MNTIFSGVRLYLGGITIIRLSSYVQDAEPFLCDLSDEKTADKADANLFAECFGTVSLRNFAIITERLRSVIIA